MSFSAAYYDAIRKDPPTSLKEVPSTFPTEPKRTKVEKPKSVKRKVAKP
jgi:hypothetical protein